LYASGHRRDAIGPRADGGGARAAPAPPCCGTTARLEDAPGQLSCSSFEAQPGPYAPPRR